MSKFNNNNMYSLANKPNIPNLDLSKVLHRINEAEYKNRFLKEKDELSITPRTFVDRTLQPMDTGDIVTKLELKLKRI